MIVNPRIYHKTNQDKQEKPKDHPTKPTKNQQNNVNNRSSWFDLSLLLVGIPTTRLVVIL